MILLTKSDIGKNVKLRNGEVRLLRDTQADLFCVENLTMCHDKNGKYLYDVKLGALSSQYDIIEVMNTPLIITENDIVGFVSEEQPYLFQNGDTVEFAGMTGVVELKDTRYYPVFVQFDNSKEHFTLEGKLVTNHPKPLLKLIKKASRKVPIVRYVIQTNDLKLKDVPILRAGTNRQQSERIAEEVGGKVIELIGEIEVND